MRVEYIISASGVINMFVPGVKLKPIPADHPNHAAIVEALQKTGGNVNEEQLRVLSDLADIGLAISRYGEGDIVVEGGLVKYQNFVLDTTPMVAKLLDLIKEGQNCKPLIRFIDNLMQNPSKASVDQLYWFLNQHGLPITEDGCFLAYKAINKDYTDKYTGKISNKVGTVVSMSRNMVMDDPEQACSYGLHCGSLTYARNYGGYDCVMVIVKVNPRDAVSVPKNECTEKLRVCEYTVVDDMQDTSKELEGVLYTVDGKRVEPNSMRAALQVPAGIFDNPSASHWDHEDDDEGDDWEEEEDDDWEYDSSN